MVKKFILVSGLLLLTFIMVEGILYYAEQQRIKQIATKHHFALYKKLYMISPDRNVSFEHRPNTDIKFISSKGERYTMHVITNSQGLREETDIPFDKPNDTKRIIGLGDSIVFGASVDNDKTFLKVMEKCLSNKKFKVQTINFGVGSSNPRLEYYYLKYKQAVNYAPRIILLGLSINDVNTAPLAFDPELGNWYNPKPIITNPKDFLSKSRVLRLINIMRYKIKPDLPISNYQKQGLSCWLKKIKDYSNKHNINFIVVLFPRKDEIAYASKTQDTNFKRHIAIKEICKKLDIPFYDLLPDLMDYISSGNNLDKLYWDDVHPWEEGHRFIGEIIANWIQKNEWLED